MEEAYRAIVGCAACAIIMLGLTEELFPNPWCILSYKMRDIQSLGLECISNLACMELRH